MGHDGEDEGSIGGASADGGSSAVDTTLRLTAAREQAPQGLATVPAQASAPADEVPGPPSDGKRRHAADLPRRKSVRVLRWTAIGVSVAVLATAGGGWLYYRHLNANITKDALNLGDTGAKPAEPNAAGQQPLNILLLGSDSRNTKEDLKLGGARDTVGQKERADVQMLLHVSADRSDMTVVSIPRDTRVTIPKCTDNDDGKVYPETSDIINTSLSHGGPGCTVATWEKLTGIHIDHFMKVSFSGVVDMADAVGGVPVCVRDNVRDEKSGLKLTKGSHTIKGEQALQWLRTRHGFEDGSDIGRTHAQHLYMNSMIRELKAGAKLTDPGKLRSLAEAATKALTVDEGLGTVKKLYDLGNDIKRVPTSRITMTTMPRIPDPQNPTAHVVPAPAAEQLFSLLRADKPIDGKGKSGKKKSADPTPTSSTPKDQVAVNVINGTGSATAAPAPGRANVVAQRLTALGYAQARPSTAVQPQRTTTLTYPDAAAKADALAVAKALGVPVSAVEQAKPSAAATGITLVIGADWKTGTRYPKSATENTEDMLRSADPLKATDSKACMKVNPNNTW
ncbi:LCP family protein [Streptomyces sp. A7024]|uniref:LCP family protein n=1 Tax=Streptomyces coryli TaxID=1128680 RepID=A0A6G4TU81_9ACTN|nr:LCP family protein [Streptomyces coryli]NGN63332.1 LCP family protein [Streptomyces coryli]